MILEFQDSTQVQLCPGDITAMQHNLTIDKTTYHCRVRSFQLMEWEGIEETRNNW